MEKQDFLNKLRKALRRTFTKQEINDILADYEGFFISGMNDGKSEDKICVELGDPEVVALELMKELPQTKFIPSISLSKDILIKVFAAILTIFVFSYYFIIYPDFNLVRDSIVLFFVFAIVLLLAFYGKRKANKSQIIVLSAGHIFLLGISILADTFIKNFIYYASRITPDNLTPKPNTVMSKIFDHLTDIESLVTFLSAIVYIFIALSILITIVAIWGFYRSTPLSFTLIVHAAGSMNYIGGVYKITHDLQDIESFIYYMDSAFKIYCVSIILTIIFIPYIVLSRRAKK